METKFDPKAKVKQGQLSDGPDGKTQTGSILILTFLNMHLENTKSLSMTQLYQLNLVQSM